MSCDLPELEQPQSVERFERLLRCSDAAGPSGQGSQLERDSETSLIDLVLLACDASEDAIEVDDLVASAIEGGAARVLPADCDPMMRHDDAGVSAQLDSRPSSARAA